MLSTPVLGEWHTSREVNDKGGLLPIPSNIYPLSLSPVLPMETTILFLVYGKLSKWVKWTIGLPSVVSLLQTRLTGPTFFSSWNALWTSQQKNMWPRKNGTLSTHWYIHTLNTGPLSCPWWSSVLTSWEVLVAPESWVSGLQGPLGRLILLLLHPALPYLTAARH